MVLQRQAAAGTDADAAHLMALAAIDGFETAPVAVLAGMVENVADAIGAHLIDELADRRGSEREVTRTASRLATTTTSSSPATPTTGPSDMTSELVVFTQYELPVMTLRLESCGAFSHTAFQFAEIGPARVGGRDGGMAGVG